VEEGGFRREPEHHSGAPLLLEVLLDHRQRRAAALNDAVRSRPEYGLALDPVELVGELAPRMHHEPMLDKQNIVGQRCKDWGSELMEIGGEADHVHALLTCHPTSTSRASSIT
jgi:hypothetical protein